MGIYNWNDSITVQCRRSDKIKLKKAYKLWVEETGIKISFHAYISCVLFPNLFKEIKERQSRKQHEQSVRIQKKYEQLLQLRKERDLKYGKRRIDSR
jgi:hypothetical protein